MTKSNQTPKIPTDPIERKKYFAQLGSKGGSSTAKSEKAVRPFADPEKAREAGSTRGYTFKRRKNAA